tara:strand:+ start:290 stop:1360 length:1071 start_codon:yes stop_codon:yes gene_type:complete
MNFTERVQSLTQDKLLPKAVDQILDSNVLALRLLSNAMKWSGEQMRKPVKYQKSTTGGSFSGLDTFDTSTSETRKRPTYDIRGAYQSIAIPGIEKAVNATDSRVMDLVKTEIESGYEDMADNIGTMFYSDGTGNSNKDFIGLGAIVDDGTDVDTLAGITRSSDTWWKATRTASGGTYTLAKLATLVSTVSAGSSNRQRPTLGVCDETVWDLHESLLNPTVRANYEAYGYPMVTKSSRGAIRPGKGLRGVSGFSAVTYRGIPIVADEKATSQTLFMLNENYLEWYGCKSPDLTPINLGSGNIDGVYSNAPSKNHGFGWTGFKVPTNQFGEVGQIILLGNLITWQPRRHGKLTGITGV